LSIILFFTANKHVEYLWYLGTSDVDVDRQMALWRFRRQFYILFYF